ncbi:hypothetical protein QJS10_CPA02g00622 [Acorus calamus]|uniref:Uncharacterized protein n=1 Tax=Acorus calamus TaxID=4465 RepID=A0AAV9FD45_ACOCL|nr:hypothetical protein QJS10_CPA02g00622 [Acorus calamus]
MTRNDVTIGELVGKLVGAEGTEHPHGGWQIGGSGLWRREVRLISKTENSRTSSKRKPTPTSAIPLVTVVNHSRQRFRRVYQPRSACPLATVVKCGRPKARRSKLARPSGDHTSPPSSEGMSIDLGWYTRRNLWRPSFTTVTRGIADLGTICNPAPIVGRVCLGSTLDPPHGRAYSTPPSPLSIRKTDDVQFPDLAHTKDILNSPQTAKLHDTRVSIASHCKPAIGRTAPSLEPYNSKSNGLF